MSFDETKEVHPVVRDTLGRSDYEKQPQCLLNG
jgi:hypothetical protein